MDRSRYSPRRSRSIAALLNLNATSDLKLTRRRTGIKHNIQAAFAVEPGIELVEQCADSGGQRRHGRRPTHNGERLLGNLLHFHHA